MPERNLLIVYATSEGHTGQIAAHLADRARDAGWKARLVRTDDPELPSDVRSFDAVILAGSVHLGQHQPAVIRFARDHREDLELVPNLLLSVSLAAASKDPEASARATAQIRDFCDQAGWVPNEVHAVGGAVAWGEYGPVMRLLMKWIVRRAGLEPLASADQDFTDWGELGGFFDEWLSRAQPG